MDIQTLDAAIRKTESRKHAEDCLTAVNKQVLVLPSIEDLPKKTVQIHKWKPVLECTPDMAPQQKGLPGPSSVEKHKSGFKMCLPCNPACPNNTVHRKFRISLPDVHKTSTNATKHDRIIAGPVMRHKNRNSHHIITMAKEGIKTVSTSRCPKQQRRKAEPGTTTERGGREVTPLCTTRTPPPPTTRMDHSGIKQGTSRSIPRGPQNQLLPISASISRYPFTIKKGRINPMATDFCHFKQSFSLCWSSVVDALEALEKLLRDFAVPLAKVSGESLVEFSHSWNNSWKKAPPVMGLLSVLENLGEVLCLVSCPGQRYKGEGGIEAAAIHIQSCWRRYVARTAYLHQCRRRAVVRIISTAWLMHIQRHRVRKALQARRCRQLENYHSRVQHLAANWKHIQSSKRTIIHIPSLGYSQSQRMKLRDFNALQDIQIGRLCDVRDENVQVIYICPRHLRDTMLQYYTSFLKCDGEADEIADAETAQAFSRGRRFIILTPEAVDYFPDHNMCLSTLVKYSPRTLKRIKNLIQGKQAYIVGRVAHMDDLAVADELGVPILAPEPVVAQHYSTKSGGRRMFVAAEVDVPPGQGDIFSVNELHESLAELMTQNMDVQRWLFKIDSEHGGRGTAYCDSCHLSCYKWALQNYHYFGPGLWNATWRRESVLARYLEEIPEWLARYARPAKTACYPNWACFLKTFLRQGGVVEACPPADSVTCLTVDLLLEPGGEVTMLSCGDQLHGACQLETIGSTVPQTSIHPETLHSICMRVGQACLQSSIVGYVSVDLATFVNHDTMEQKVWAVDLDVTYSDQLAMTQMLLMITGGRLNCSTLCLEVPVAVKEKCCERQTAAKPPLCNLYAVIGNHLFHSSLFMYYHTTLVNMCKSHGIGFNVKKKQGTLFAPYESSGLCSIGMITISKDLQGALVTFAQNLSVIQQAISPSKIPAETNFKEVIKEIEYIQQMTGRNETRAAEDKNPAV